MSGMSSQSSAQKRACDEVSLPYSSTILPPPSSPTRPGSPIIIGSSLEGSPTAEGHAPLWDCEELTNHCQVASINMLPDDVMLEIFDSYRDECRIDPDEEQWAWETWESLVHVCSQWRRIVFGSPRRLGLQLLCTPKTPARDMLDVWPVLPLLIKFDGYGQSIGSLDNVIAGLERTDRVRQIVGTNFRSLDMEYLIPEMQQPLPELTSLELWSDDEMVPVFPDSFLGGSAPRLESLFLQAIPFPGLPKLLLSTTHLTTFCFHSIPHSGYVSPYAMAATLSTLTSLDDLSLEFESPRSFPDPGSRRPPPSTRFVVPVLTLFRFKGVSKYLEDLVACIDAPQLNTLDITFFHDITFVTPRLIQFICRTPRSKALDKAYIALNGRTVRVDFSSQTSHRRNLRVELLCRGLDRQVSSLEQVLTSCLPPLSMLEDLYFYDESPFQPEGRQWLRLFRPFMAVKNLYLPLNYASRIAPALQELVVEGRTTEVLPALQNIFVEGLESSETVQESIGNFVAARQAANHPIGIFPWTDSEEGRGLGW